VESITAAAWPVESDVIFILDKISFAALDSCKGRVFTTAIIW
jgi:hypothetical protein